ncbi:hypothetical protein ACHAXT_008216 [Thalassiosira profunda]
MGKKGGGRVRVKQVGGPKMPANPLADLAVPPEEMIHLPPKPDSNAGFLIWPMDQTFSMVYKNFSAIYPNYLDSDKTVKRGRRIGAKDAVPEPNVQDIHEALVSLNIRHVVQPHKLYSRDATSHWDNPGRVLVDLEGAVESGVMEMKSDGAFDLDDAMPEMGGDNDGKENEQGEGRGKKQLLRQLASIIRGLPSRQKRLEEKNKLLEEEKAKAAKAEKEAAKTKTGGGGGGGGNRKKKGKKKK